MTKTIDGSGDLVAKMTRDHKIKWNFVFFFVALYLIARIFYLCFKEA
ncbi:hypothetical protein [uncultured Roseibium sp.]|nr:hypothetical protein [uncultured Roseibium sp.]